MAVNALTGKSARRGPLDKMTKNHGFRQGKGSWDAGGGGARLAATEGKGKKLIYLVGQRDGERKTTIGGEKVWVRKLGVVSFVVVWWQMGSSSDATSGSNARCHALADIPKAQNSTIQMETDWSDHGLGRKEKASGKTLNGRNRELDGFFQV